MEDNGKIVLIGGGGHGRSVLDAAIRSKVFSQIVITDPDISAGSEILGCQVVGADEMLPGLLADGFKQAFVAIGSIKSTEHRREVFRRASEIGFSFPNIIDPSAVIGLSVKMGRGIFVGKNAVINADAEIDDMAIINTGAIVEHGCHVGAFAHVSVGAVVCGDVRVGDDAFIGANATVIQGVTVPNGGVIGAGCVVKH